jgi:hypothetical protein
MFDLVIPQGTYHRTNGNLPPFELVNMLAESTPSAKGGVSLLSFPGLATSVTRGAGPIVGVYRRTDLFGGATFSFSNGHLYKDATDLGAVAGSGPVSWASSDIELVVTRGGAAYSYNGTNLAAITFPDSANVTAVTFLVGLFIFARAGSHKYYWSAVLDARTIDALDFASAESSPDRLLDVLALGGGDTLALAGKDSIEFHYPTGNAVLPFLKIQQRTAAIGVIATGCMAEMDNALHYIGQDRSVYRMADVPTVVSNEGIAEQIAASSTYSLFKYIWQGHSVLMIRLATASYGFDARTGLWHERRTTGLTNWAAQCACQADAGTPLFGSSTGGELLVYSGWAEGLSELSREFTAAIPLTSTDILDSIELECNSGQTTVLGSAPLIEMRYSRDGGNTWGAFTSVPLGGVGEYRARAKWRRLGMFDAPGALFHFRVTDPVPFRASSAFGGESSAGRSRV